MKDGFRIALLISGGGTTAVAIIEACNSGRLKGIVPACVIASRPDAGGIKRVKAAGMNPADVLIIPPTDFSSPLEFGKAIVAACIQRGVVFVGQYGWLSKTPLNVIEAFKGMMVNQHPGPLDPGRPDFGGKGMFGRRVHCARLFFVRKTNRDFWSEATAQRVAEEFDKGVIVKMKTVPILQNDTVETLQARMLPEEHKVQIETLEDFAAGRVHEFVRGMPLVRFDEEAILEEAKRFAIHSFPEG